MLLVKSVVFALLILSLQGLAVPSLVWVFLEDPQSLNSLEQLTLNNIRHFSSQSNYQLRVITPSNYSQYINSTQITAVSSSNFLSPAVLLRSMVQWTILQKYGGVWVDLPVIFTQSLEWVETVVNQRHINNRIDPKTVLFYSPQWMEKTQKRTELKVEDLVVYPNYHTWFIATEPESQFISDCRQLIVRLVSKTDSQLASFYRTYDLNAQQYLQQPGNFGEWIVRATIRIMQTELDKQYTGSRKLAVSHYFISGINTEESAYLLAHQARGHTHLTTKYFTEMPIDHSSLKFAYLLLPSPPVAAEIAAIIDPALPMSQHLHSSVSLLCGEGEIPYRHVLTGSIIEQFLFQLAPAPPPISYSPQFIKQHCSTTYQSVFFELLTSYLLPAFAALLHLYVVRRMILIFRPEWGVRRKVAA